MMRLATNVVYLMRLATNLVYNVTCIPIAKQRLRKQAKTIQIVVYGVRAATVVIQWFGKHISTTDCVFCVVRAEELS
jgi:hypothetical protein